MEIKNIFRLCRILISGLCFLFFQHAAGQLPGNYAYLKNCFSNGPIDSFEIEVTNLGEIMSYNLTGDSTIDVLFTYFRVPDDKLDMKLTKIAELAAERQKDTWKNNSKLVYYKKTETASATIIDYRLHVLIEDIYMQVIVISEREWVYEIDCFRDKNEKKFFDGLTRKVMDKDCL